MAANLTGQLVGLSVTLRTVVPVFQGCCALYLLSRYASKLKHAPKVGQTWMGYKYGLFGHPGP